MTLGKLSCMVNHRNRALSSSPFPLSFFFFPSLQIFHVGTKKKQNQTQTKPKPPNPTKTQTKPTKPTNQQKSNQPQPAPGAGRARGMRWGGGGGRRAGSCWDTLHPWAPRYPPAQAELWERVQRQEMLLNGTGESPLYRDIPPQRRDGFLLEGPGKRWQRGTGMRSNRETAARVDINFLAALWKR